MRSIAALEAKEKGSKETIFENVNLARKFEDMSMYFLR